MKKWQPQPAENKTGFPGPISPAIDMGQFDPPPVPSMPWLECIGCKKRAVILFEGTSFCRGCLKFEITTGQKRRHYDE